MNTQTEKKVGEQEFISFSESSVEVEFVEEVELAVTVVEELSGLLGGTGSDPKVEA